ncbi:MAG: hypothetical protein L0322_08860 [Chloroflexi bacterium]|nr:hypothetical protein [Chloroflexota bacterium]MCI0575791.1 hypothetical protein [Chloroflexota bacterium]MCI0644882.1 hypothetical protein [Chloroflexota bacterium]
MNEKPSTALLAANERLLAVRAEAAARREAEGREQAAPAAPPYPPPPALSQISALPPHLGWESEVVTRHLRAAAARRAQQTAQLEAERRDWLPSVVVAGREAPATDDERPAAEQQPPAAGEFTLALYPDLALAMLREGQVAAGRIWLLVRYLDGDGRGWLDVATLYARLAGDDSPFRVCGQRQLGKLLQRGDGLFWQRDEARLWLRSAAKVAAALGLERLSGRPVALPVQVLLGSIGDVRAHFYASFHSGRAALAESRGGGTTHADSCQKEDLGENREAIRAALIARATLAEMSGVSRRTQQAYERRAGVRVQVNVALGPAASAGAEDRQALAWQRGRALFRFVDRRGRQEMPGRAYWAWRLPNSYLGPHAPLPHGRQRRLNRKLAVLRETRGAGNGRNVNDDKRRLSGRRYYHDGAAAARAWERNGRAVYWPRGGRLGVVLWAILGEE